MCEVDQIPSTSIGNLYHRIGENFIRHAMTKPASNPSNVRGESSSQEEIGKEIVPDPAMKTEIEAAVGFLTDFLVKAPQQQFSSESVDRFRRCLENILYYRYNGHWHPSEPLRGSGFRCLRINGKLDPVVASAAEASQLPLRKVRQAFPAELTVWVDPGDVSMRFGEDGSIGVWYESRRAFDDEEQRPQQKNRQNFEERNHVYSNQMYQRNSPTLSSTPPGMQAAFAHGFHQPHHQFQPQYHQRQSPPVWNPQWQHQAFAGQQQHPNRSSPSPFVTTMSPANNNGFVMALNHQQQQMQLRQQPHTPIRYNTAAIASPSRVSPQPMGVSATSPSESENGEEQRCKVLAERLMRENINLMASLAPGLVSSRPQPVGVGVN